MKAISCVAQVGSCSLRLGYLAGWLSVVAEELPISRSLKRHQYAFFFFLRLGLQNVTCVASCEVMIVVMSFSVVTRIRYAVDQGQGKRLDWSGHNGL